MSEGTSSAPVATLMKHAQRELTQEFNTSTVEEHRLDCRSDGGHERRKMARQRRAVLD
jgi:hypothetical protein